MALIAVQSARLVNGEVKLQAMERGVFTVLVHHDMAHAAQELRAGHTVNVEVTGDSLRRLMEYVKGA